MGRRVRVWGLTLCLLLAPAAQSLADATLDFQEAIAAARAGNMDKAIDAFSRVITAGASLEARNLASAYNMRGVCYEAKKQYQEALADYTKAIETYDKASEALGNRSLLYYKLGDMDKAKADAVAAKRIDRKVRVPKFDE
jgi:tetratricopeptide (TPR) repeat protein